MKLYTVGERVKYLRFLAGLSRQDIEDYNNFPVHALKRLEGNLRIINDIELESIINLFSKSGIVVDLSWLKTGKGICYEKNKPKVNSFDHLDILSQESESFLALINNECIPSYISKNWVKFFNPIITKNSSIIKILGMQIKPYIDQVLSGDTIRFNYIGDDSKCLSLRCITRIFRKTIQGFYLFAD